MRNKEKNRSKHINLKAATTPHKARKDWLIVQLRDVAEVIGGGTPSTSHPEYWNGNISWVTPKDLSEYSNIYISKGAKNITEKGLKKSSAKILPKNAVLLSTRAPIGYVAVAKNPLSTNQGFRSLILNHKVKHEYIYYILKSKTQLLNSLGSGATFKELSGSKLKQIKIPLAPLPEQKAIVQKIESVFKLIDSSEEELKSAKEKLKVYRQAVLKKAFDGKLLSKKELDICKQRKDWKPVNKLLKDISPKATTPHKTRKDWLVVQLRDVAEVIGGGTPSTSHPEYWNGNISWVTPKDLSEYSNIYISKGAKNITEKGLKKSSAKILPKNAVLLSTRAPIGYVAVAKNPLSTNQGFRSLILNHKVKHEYIYYILKSKTQLLNSLGSGATFKELSGSKLKQIKIPLAPLPEQKAIVRKIEKNFSYCDRLQSEIEQNLENIKLLRQSVLKKAFSGTFLNKRELEKCKKSADWKSAKDLLAEIQKEHRNIKIEKNNLKPKRKRKVV